MIYELPQLPYAYDALEPHIDARTMEIHYTKHHNGYVTKLNDAIANCPEIADRPLTTLLSDISLVPAPYRTAIRNNGGGHLNHSLYWEIMSPSGGGEPAGELADRIRFSFGGFDDFTEQLTQVALQRFGSGWAWLGVDGAGRLEVFSTPNQDSPLMLEFTPILGVDLWEHAYYLHYQNRRADYIAAWWNVVNWTQVGELYLQTRQVVRPAT